MTWILRDLPYQTDGYILALPEQKTPSFEIRPYQMVCWASLTSENHTWLGTEFLPCFPVIIDTGHGGNFAIQERHLEDWTQAGPLPAVQRNSEIRINGTLASRRRATLWLYQNVPGRVLPNRAKAPIPVDFSTGIEVVPSSENYPRLPLLGMGSLYIARLELTINGFGRHMSLQHLPRPS